MKFLNREVITRPMHEVALPPAQDAAAYPGAQLLGQDGRIYRSERYPTANDPYQWLSTAEIAEDVAADVFRVLSDPLTITVGAGGDYATLGAALRYLSQFTPAADVAYPLAIVRILSGTVLAEQIELRGVRLAWADIRADDPEVLVDVTAITQPIRGRYTFFHGSESEFPGICCLFRATGSNPTAAAGINGIHGINVDQSRVAIVPDPSLDDGDGIDVPPAGFVEFGTNLRAERADVRAGACLFDDAVEYGVLASNSRVGLPSAKCRRAGTAGILAINGAIVTIGVGLGRAGLKSDARRVNDVNGPNDTVVSAGGIVSLNSSVAYDGGFSQAVNSVTEHGIIFATGGAAPIVAGLIAPQSYTFATVPSAAANTGVQIFVSNGAAGAPIMAFSDGTNWLRCDTRAVITAS
jgi:hypothetical protein